ncbi:unnamed protein product [Moneuplotes crassus]|uniref:Uncharacterized protein n=1 Tax=Euplotes crassus TaxID=5936 RepID=A0AAD1UJ32_EUPCR|nr:unnamed protein product [Moneuplotes crassus]
MKKLRSLIPIPRIISWTILKVQEIMIKRRCGGKRGSPRRQLGHPRMGCLIIRWCENLMRKILKKARSNYERAQNNISEFNFSELLDDFEDEAAEEKYLKTYKNTFTNAIQEKKPSSTAFLAQQLKCQKRNHRKSMHNILEITPRGSDMFSHATPKANKLRRKVTDAKYQGKVIGFNEGIQFKRDMTFREREGGTKIFHFSVV